MSISLSLAGNGALTSVLTTMVASLKSIGTACTLAGVGVYLQCFGFVSNDGKRTLALISQQVTFPLYLFTKILYCNQDWSDKKCPDVTETLQQVWILVLWPLYVVGTGLIVGYIIAIVAKVPLHQRRAVIAACGFGNSTGLPITLLTVIHSNFPSSSDLGRIDPTLFLSVYLLLYPALQWGIGGWMLAPMPEPEITDNSFDNNDTSTTPTAMTVNETSALLHPNNNGIGTTKANNETDDKNDNQVVQGGNNINNHTIPSPHKLISHSLRSLSLGSVDKRQSISGAIRHNVLNNAPVNSFYKNHRHGLCSADESMYLSELDLPTLLKEQIEREQHELELLSSLRLSTQVEESSSKLGSSSHHAVNDSFDSSSHIPVSVSQQQQQQIYKSPSSYGAFEHDDDDNNTNSSCNKNSDHHQTRNVDPWSPSNTKAVQEQNQKWKAWNFDSDTMLQSIKNVFDRCFQPPVMGSIFGIIAAATPIRGYFVDLVDLRSHAPLQWMFDGLHTVGQTSVPINMMILGCNLASSYSKGDMSVSGNTSKDGMFSLHANIGIVVGKLIIIPFIGIMTVYILKHYILHVNDNIDGALYLVMMIVFLCPTANNVMIMVELSGSNAKESIARVIAIQYAVAPVILSVVMTIAIGVADSWS